MMCISSLLMNPCGRVFSGAALRSKSIDFMLELLSSTQSLKFDIQGDGTIMIYKK